MLKEDIVIKTLNEQKTIKGKDLNDYIPYDDALIQALLNMDQDGILDMTEYKKLDEPSFVDREKELAQLKESLERNSTGI